MGVEIRLSSKGQIVIPKDMRDSLHLKAGDVLSISRQGRRIVVEAAEEPLARISYEAFRRRIPRHEGPPVSIEDMDLAVDAMFAGQGKP